MFGAIYTVGVIIGGTIDGIKCVYENIQCKNRANKRNDNITNTYYDRKGIQRDIRTDQIATIKTDINNDEYLYLGTPGIKIKNISEEKRKMDFELCKKGDWCGRTVDLYDKRYWSVQGSNKYKTIIHGAYYKDLINDNIYVCRKFKLYFDRKQNNYTWMNKDNNLYPIYCKFYMDIKNGFLIRKADTQISYEKEYPECTHLTDTEAEIFIAHFNQMQKNGGWYHSQKYKYGDKKILEKQDYYCDDFVDNDHINNLLTERR